jgi:hypothetical protein
MRLNLECSITRHLYGHIADTGLNGPFREGSVAHHGRSPLSLNMFRNRTGLALAGGIHVESHFGMLFA